MKLKEWKSGYYFSWVFSYLFIKGNNNTIFLEIKVAMPFDQISR
jgi:hypothetical protein